MNIYVYSVFFINSCDDDLNRIESASESDENAIELKNSCRRLMEKPPLVRMTLVCDLYK